MHFFRFNTAIKILLCTNALILIAVAMLGPIYALFVEQIGGTLLDASIAGFVLAISAGIVVLFTGTKVDKAKHKAHFVALGYTLMATGFFLFTITNSLRFLLIVQAIIGIGEAIYSVSFDALYSLHLDKHHEGEERGAWEAMQYIVTACGALAGGFLATKRGFDTLFVVMGCLCLCSGLYIYIVSRKHLST